MFRSSLRRAEQLAFEHGRFVILYIEDEGINSALELQGSDLILKSQQLARSVGGPVRSARASARDSEVGKAPPIETLAHRQALADPTLTQFINDKVLNPLI